jgi:hypothetical protein
MVVAYQTSIVLDPFVMSPVKTQSSIFLPLGLGIDMKPIDINKP